jgi:hypothetical protein
MKQMSCSSGYLNFSPGQNATKKGAAPNVIGVFPNDASKEELVKHEQEHDLPVV